MPKQLSALPVGKEVRIFIQAAEADGIRSAEKVGFSLPLTTGDSVLPQIVGCATKRNAEGYDIIHKDQPKENRVFNLATRRSLFCGRGRREIVEDYHSFRRPCYPKTIVSPLGLELTYIETEKNNSYYTSAIFKIGENDVEIIDMINVFLDLYGTCLVEADEEFDQIPIRRVNWELLPQGAVTANSTLEPLISSIQKSSHRVVAQRQLSKLYSYSPKALAVGLGGFSSYVAFVYEKQGFVVLESVEPNNATYIFAMDWEGVSQLSKGEIIRSGLHLDRIVHDSNWLSNIEKLLSSRRAA